MALKMDETLVSKVEMYVQELISKKSPRHHLYHSLEHTREVVAAALEIAKSENVTEEELEIVTIAAWFHDTGYVKKTDGHEELSAKFASEFLAGHNFPPSKIQTITNCILATKVPQKPKNLLEKIICDADLSHLGRKSFESRNDLFRFEFEHYFGRKLKDDEWLIKTIDFVSRHEFFTDYARNHFTAILNENLKKLKEQLNNLK